MSVVVKGLPGVSKPQSPPYTGNRTGPPDWNTLISLGPAGAGAIAGSGLLWNAYLFLPPGLVIPNGITVTSNILTFPIGTPVTVSSYPVGFPFVLINQGLEVYQIDPTSGTSLAIAYEISWDGGSTWSTRITNFTLNPGSALVGTLNSPSYSLGGSASATKPLTITNVGLRFEATNNGGGPVIVNFANTTLFLPLW